MSDNDMKESITLESIHAISPLFRLQWEEVQDAFVILYPEGMVKLSQSAGETLNRVNGKITISDIIKDLEAQFEGADLTDDVLQLFEVSKENGWIKTS
jgi:pyrroloquinoline quinone biosynthesis protein D